MISQVQEIQATIIPDRHHNADLAAISSDLFLRGKRRMEVGAF
jgi:hypothetical protein